MKRLQEWREVPIDKIAHGFEYLCQDHDAEIIRGRYRLKTYKLRPKLYYLYDRVQDKPVFPKTVSPEDIVKTMQMGLSEVKQQVL